MIFNECSYFIEFIKLVAKKEMLGKALVLSIFRNEFNKFNDTRARVLDSICPMTLKVPKMPFLE